MTSEEQKKIDRLSRRLNAAVNVRDVAGCYTDAIETERQVRLTKTHAITIMGREGATTPWMITILANQDEAREAALQCAMDAVDELEGSLLTATETLKAITESDKP